MGKAVPAAAGDAVLLPCDRRGLSLLGGSEFISPVRHGRCQLPSAAPSRAVAAVTGGEALRGEQAAGHRRGEGDPRGHHGLRV